MKKLAGNLALLTILSGCASMIEGQTQNVSISTNPPAQVMCDAKNERGAWKVSPIAGSVSSVPVKRSQSRLFITCEGDGYKGEVSNKADMEAWAAMNFLWGLSSPIAFIVDASTGALFSYDDAITVPLIAQNNIGENGSIPTGKFPMLMGEQPPAAAPAAEPAPAPASAPAASAPAPQQTAPASGGLMTYDEMVARGLIVNAPAK